jgi:hypothetical protein
MRRGGRTDACRFLRIAIGPAVYRRPFWKPKKYLATLPPDTVSLFSSEERALIRQRISDLRDWSVAVGAALPAVGESQSPRDGADYLRRQSMRHGNGRSAYAHMTGTRPESLP